MSDPYRSVKIKQETYKTAKIRAAEMGVSLIDYFEFVVGTDKLISTEMKNMSSVVQNVPIHETS